MNETVTDDDPPTVGGDDQPPNEIDAVEASDYCEFCESDPCVIVDLQEVLSSILNSYRDDKTNKQIRFMMYRDSVRFIHGSLGKGVRKKLPACVQAKIHSMVPDEVYTGFTALDNA